MDARKPLLLALLALLVAAAAAKGPPATKPDKDDQETDKSSKCMECAAVAAGARCTGHTIKDGNSIITLDFSSVKENGDTVGWAACVGAAGAAGACALDADSCSDGADAGKSLCSSLGSAKWSVPVGTASVTLQAKDGLFIGDKECTAEETYACAGGHNNGCSDTTGVCEFDFAIAGCPAAIEESVVPIARECTEEEWAGCNGAAAETECAKATCSALGAEHTCGLELDAAKTCFTNTFGSCRATTTCTASSEALGYACPVVASTKGTACRGAADACDMAESCDGESTACPFDFKVQQGYTLKCGSAIYTCMPEGEAPALKGKSSAYEFAGTTLGAAKDGVSHAKALPYPACLRECVALSMCANNKGLGNMAFFTCAVDGASWSWAPAAKIDVGSGTPLPYCPWDQSLPALLPFAYLKP
ncbi:MAG: hypothetical protein J3K34DRAFT_19145 [Monoraphidium minutum]|nr:MAG: hypothetical protein J3K34DRAFT_19145 [Monoraphidium minutum]